MEIKSTSPNFGMAVVKTKKAERYLNRLPYNKAIEIKVMEMDCAHQKVDAYVSTIEKNGKERLKVEVGHKTFIENFFRGPLKTMRKSIKFLNKLEETQEAERALTKDMNIPNLG